MRLAFENALRRSPSHSLAPAIKRALKHTPREYGGWFVLNKSKGDKRRGKRSR